ncbi:hypothetical protein HID58_043657, partial [Brassica napus]
WKTRVHVTNASSKKVATGLVADRLSNEFEGEQKSERSSFTSFREDPKPTAPWVGAASWAFISLPKIKFELAPFRLFNLMGIPVLSMQKICLDYLSAQRKIVLDFQKGKGKAVGPISEDLKSGDFVGELSVTLVNAQKLPYMFSGRTDPYVILRMGDQVIRSKKNSQNSIGAPGQPIWNQDFQFLVSNPREQVLQIEVNDCLGFADMAIGTGQVDLGSLPDTSYYCGLHTKHMWRMKKMRNAMQKPLLHMHPMMKCLDSEEPSSFVQNDKIPSDNLSQRVHVTGTFKDWREFKISTGRFWQWAHFRVSIVVVRCNYFSIGARFYQYGQLKYLQPVTWCCVDH